jgi:hypothetical protein
MRIALVQDGVIGYVVWRRARATEVRLSLPSRQASYGHDGDGDARQNRQ